MVWTATPVVLLVLFYLFGGLDRPRPKSVSWSEFENRMLLRHAVDSIDVINNEDADIYIKRSFSKDPYFAGDMKDIEKITFPVAQFRVHIGSVEQLQKKLDETEQGVAADQRVRLNFTKKTGPLSGIWGWIIPVVVFLVAMRLMTRGGDGGGGQRSISAGPRRCCRRTMG
ncbi:ATP-dependent metallopeptidase FtsH/Yme1/Tma family protein [Puia sp. P3]|uniref:ATP-dependent metallopeptidase FtsH/Yme1/Tma family protein n=1 Tax=Puia sp. P3 TaxID=3423952 RepID=UPI003D67DC96